ncbi:adenylate/guanylate cyclase domain-containing protein [Bdellovibrio bacteriovorus]|nr:adenylate/guanylate cyclase domain-containing protein [Bdellovibrio bacteriovorus]
MKTDKISYFLGVAVTVVFVFLSMRFYTYQTLRNEEKDPKSIVGFLETLDLKMLDLKMQIRGVEPTSAPVALVAIDDPSLEEVGRWPWARKVIAQMTDQIFTDGAKSIGYDVIFSEPQIGDPTSDQMLAESLTKHRDKVVTGSFAEPAGDLWLPYQDYCVNEAFIRANGGDVVRLNASFVVEDRADFYESVDFGKLLNPFFEIYEGVQKPKIIKDELKISEDRLTDAQKRYVQIQLWKRNFEFCRDWLTEHDSFLPGHDANIDKAYAEAFNVKPEELKTAIAKFKNKVLRHPLPASWNWTANLPKIQEGVDFNSSFNAFQDTDGSVRRMPLFYRTGNRMGTSFVPTLSLQTYLTGMGYRAQVVVDRSSRNPKMKEIVGFDIFDPSQEPEKKVFSLSTDKYSFMRINYYGGTYSIPHVSAREILRQGPTIKVIQREWDQANNRWKVDQKEMDRKAFFKDRMVIIGATATGVYDLRVTPFEKNFPGPEIHVQALAQMFDQKFLVPWEMEGKVMPWVILVLGILLSILWTQTGAVAGIVVSMSAIVLIVGVDLLMFLKFHVMLSAVIPLFLLVFLNFTVLQTFKYLTEERKKKELKSTFAKYVSPAIVDEVLKAPENLELGGRKQRMTVFFSDVRGFTTLSESLEPQKLSEILSRYLSPMTEIVFKNKGTLDKYMGDALMAFFGAPIPYPQHAQEACRTALQHLVKLAELQEEFKKEGIPTIDIGIGINTGDMSVGNMGSNIVRSYTVMGDAVNLGSRLEGINKEYGTRVIISEFTYAEVKEKFVCREIDQVKVKGKTKPVRIFELVAEGNVSEDKKKRLDIFEEAYRKYEQKKFAEALIQFETLVQGETVDPVAEVYVERCQEFITNPPPENWDGVFVMTKK